MRLFQQIPYIPTSEELADMIFSQLKNIRVTRPKGAKYRRSEHSFYKTLYFRQFRFIFNEIDERLETIVKSFPQLDMLHPFHEELIDVIIGLGNLRVALSRIKNSRRTISKIHKDVSKKLGFSRNADEAKRIRREALGRLGSVIDQLAKPLSVLIEAKTKLIKVPDFQVDQRTIAFAGAPNAGKSSFVKIVSSGRPEIASYPFTTKNLNCGHIKRGFETIQLIDTPGLLDRPIHERNKIEMRSILALKHLADIIIYLFDPSIQAALSVEQQINLKNEIKEEFPNIPILKYINKKDLLSPSQIKEVKNKVGDLDLIATIPSEKEQLLKVINKALSLIPEKKSFKQDIKKMKEKEKEEEPSRDEIEWIFL
ncbi:MAG: GTPase, partial [Asgard group archaeon]|nr:GTPase [Asgard group archaeon]